MNPLSHRSSTTPAVILAGLYLVIPQNHAANITITSGTLSLFIPPMARTDTGCSSTKSMPTVLATRLISSFTPTQRTIHATILTIRRINNTLGTSVNSRRTKQQASRSSWVPHPIPSLSRNQGMPHTMAESIHHSEYSRAPISRLITTQTTTASRTSSPSSSLMTTFTIRRR